MKLYDIYGNVIFESEGATTKGGLATRAYQEGRPLYRANLYRADLSGANLYRADLSGADLSGADLYRADLSGADLSGADLSGADLSGANLYRADLSRADLSGAKGINAFRVTPLLMLLDQPGKLRAYKLVNRRGEGPHRGGIVYEIGQSYEVADANTDVNAECAAGINVATLDWVMNEWQPGCRILIVEFEAADIAAIPTATDGKFRLFRCSVVGEKDLAEIGLVETVEATP